MWGELLDRLREADLKVSIRKTLSSMKNGKSQDEAKRVHRKEVKQ